MITVIMLILLFSRLTDIQTHIVARSPKVSAFIRDQEVVSNESSTSLIRVLQLW